MEKIEHLYYLLVNRVPVISFKYQAYRRKTRGLKRVLAWAYLAKLNLQYYILKDKSAVNEELLYKTKKLYLKGSESSLSIKESPAELAKKLSAYDVISFDVFDTLIFRPFSDPTDIFYFVGKELEYLDFKNIRVNVEKELRVEKKNVQGTSEISLNEIWIKIEALTGIPKEIGKEIEWNCEKEFCFANPYMLEVWRELQKLNCTCIVVSDMYLSQENICTLLKLNKFENLKKCFVSNEYGCSKAEGTLYSLVKETMGRDKSYIHIGDNIVSDKKNAEKYGFKTECYPNINEIGMQYRTEDMSAITGTVYRGIVNAHIHNGMYLYSRSYEYGFIYGGLFVLGYCEWIHQYVKQNNIDKILFLARDGDVLSKVYTTLYPESKKSIDFEYVYWSRMAATKMSADYFKYDFFRRFLTHKINQGYTLQQIFASMDLEELFPEFLDNVRNRGKYAADSILREKEAEDIQNYLNLHWKKVLNIYSEQVDEGKKYFEKILDGVRNVVAVDVGWAGSGAVTLNHMVNHVWKLNCKITGLIAGSNSFFSQEQDASEPLLYSGKLVSYMFSQEHNRDIWKLHNPNQGHNIIVELLLASEERSFRGFYSKGPEFSKRTDEINAAEVQKGILDFVSLYLKRMGSVSHISGRDAYAPIKLLIENGAYLKQVIASEHVKMNLE